MFFKSDVVEYQYGEYGIERGPLYSETQADCRNKRGDGQEIYEPRGDFFTLVVICILFKIPCTAFSCQLLNQYKDGKVMVMFVSQAVYAVTPLRVAHCSPISSMFSTKNFVK